MGSDHPDPSVARKRNNGYRLYDHNILQSDEINRSNVPRPIVLWCLAVDLTLEQSWLPWLLDVADLGSRIPIPSTEKIIKSRYRIPCAI